MKIILLIDSLIDHHIKTELTKMNNKYKEKLNFGIEEPRPDQLVMNTNNTLHPSSSIPADAFGTVTILIEQKINKLLKKVIFSVQLPELADSLMLDLEGEFNVARYSNHMTEAELQSIQIYKSTKKPKIIRFKSFTKNIVFETHGVIYHLFPHSTNPKMSTLMTAEDITTAMKPATPTPGPYIPNLYGIPPPAITIPPAQATAPATATATAAAVSTTPQPDPRLIQMQTEIRNKTLETENLKNEMERLRLEMKKKEDGYRQQLLDQARAHSALNQPLRPPAPQTTAPPAPPFPSLSLPSLSPIPTASSSDTQSQPPIASSPQFLTPSVSVLQIQPRRLSIPSYPPAAHGPLPSSPAGAEGSDLQESPINSSGSTEPPSNSTTIVDNEDYYETNEDNIQRILSEIAKEVDKENTQDPAVILSALSLMIQKVEDRDHLVAITNYSENLSKRIQNIELPQQIKNLSRKVANQLKHKLEEITKLEKEQAKMELAKAKSEAKLQKKTKA